ncbi:MAG: deoxyribodipyrimidine photolyase [Gammaproteobacteria bacterium]|nr:deoxyribodipyrimidine photolyase [Gammaproteobacteria bacterium]HBF07419.1 deoxyribodipyrimidine photolyase [Gammaproteobacteria bacterium]|tara:strand:+ start:12436 stop:13845 length:1410 start_codon:yes stop_codon:yes gene_type:complete
MTQPQAIHWFRQDLRLDDNPALAQAVQQGVVLPVYILDDINSHEYKMGGASRVWLHHSLNSLNKSLQNKLSLFKGNPIEVLQHLCEKHHIKMVTWNRCYEPWRIARDTEIKTKLTGHDIQVISCNGSLLWEPWTVLKSNQEPYHVFTQFYRKGCLKTAPPRQPIEPVHVSAFKDSESLALEALDLLPRIKWDSQMLEHWAIGEEGAQESLQRFIEQGLSDYKKSRDFPALNYVSRLSPHLHFGEISPHRVWYSILQQENSKNREHYCSELGWREFSHHLLFHHQDLPSQNLQPKYDQFPWGDDPSHLKAWQTGQTGIPFVDAGMRELWQTGYMHNRARLIVGSYLTKNLRLDWRHGERWFWDCLFDADLANNAASWQWVAGTGADAAEYVRIFNPVIQGHKFDPDGDYVRHYVPELKDLPIQHLFSPWDASPEVLEKAGIKLGKNYPYPIVDFKTSRDVTVKMVEALDG